MIKICNPYKISSNLAALEQNNPIVIKSVIHHEVPQATECVCECVCVSVLQNMPLTLAAYDNAGGLLLAVKRIL